MLFIFSMLRALTKMPSISISFNSFLLLLLLQIAAIPVASGQLPQFNSQQMNWLGDRVFANECNRNFSCLTSWNEGEDFPSLGIGHFIWYSSQQNERFEETFPILLAFYKKHGYELPAWLEALENLDSPWRTGSNSWPIWGALECSAARILRLDHRASSIVYRRKIA